MNIGTWLGNVGQSMASWADGGMLLLGILLIIVAAVKIAMGFMSHGKGQTNWLLYIGMLLVGGFFVASKFAGMQKLADVGAQTIGSMGAGTSGADEGTP